MTEPNDHSEIKASGTFHVTSDYWFLCGIPMLIILGIGLYFAIPHFMWALENKEIVGRFSARNRWMMGCGILLVPLFICGIIFNYVKRGRECRFVADGEKFTVRSKNHPDEYIYYQDVQNVRYEPLHLLWINNGYKVSIETKYKTIVYNYSFPGFGRPQPTEHLPFEVIRNNIVH